MGTGVGTGRAAGGLAAAGRAGAVDTTRMPGTDAGADAGAGDGTALTTGARRIA